MYTNTRSEFFQTIAYVVFILGSIAGLLVGILIPEVTQVGGTIFNPEVEESFNFALSIYCWIGTFLGGSIFLFFASVVSYFEIITRKLNRFEKENQKSLEDKTNKIKWYSIIQNSLA